jgi:hypothetical protein
MYRSFARLAPLVVLLVVSSCSDRVDTPTEPDPTTIVETFPASGPGTLTLNGAFSYPFTVTVAGSMEAALTVLEPDQASPVGLALGTWNGSSCQIVIANDASILNSRVAAVSSAVGDFCVRIYDSTGTMARPQTFQILVAHQ